MLTELSSHAAAALNLQPCVYYEDNEQANTGVAGHHGFCSGGWHDEWQG